MIADTIAPIANKFAIIGNPPTKGLISVAPILDPLDR